VVRRYRGGRIGGEITSNKVSLVKHLGLLMTKNVQRVKKPVHARGPTLWRTSMKGEMLRVIGNPTTQPFE
jgi:hypothetical protein